MVNIKKYVKYIIFGGFIGLLLVYLHFKRVNVKWQVKETLEVRQISMFNSGSTEAQREVPFLGRSGLPDRTGGGWKRSLVVSFITSNYTNLYLAKAIYLFKLINV